MLPLFQNGLPLNPGDAASLAGTMAILAGLGAAVFGVFLVLYIFSALVIMAIAKKTNTEPKWLAWVPIANLYLLVKISGLAWWWFLVMLFGGIIPIVGSFAVLGASIYVWWKICEKLNKPGWWSLLLMIPLVNFVIMGILAWEK